MAGVYVCSDVCHEAFFLPICYKNYFCSIKYVKVMQFSMGCCAEGTREPQQNVRRLPRLDCPRSQAQERQSGRSASGPWALVEPRDNAVDIDGGGDRDVLQVGLRHAPIPGPSQPKGAHPLRERPFDAGPPLIELLALLTGIPGLRRCERLVLVLGRQPQPSARVLGTGTGGPHGTRPTRRAWRIPQ